MKRSRLAFARFGASLALCDRDANGLSRVARAIDEIGTPVVTGVLDVRDRQQDDAFVADAVAALTHRVDVLVNNAGGGFEAYVPGRERQGPGRPHQ